MAKGEITSYICECVQSSFFDLTPVSTLKFCGGGGVGWWWWVVVGGGVLTNFSVQTSPFCRAEQNRAQVK